MSGPNARKASTLGKTFLVLGILGLVIVACGALVMFTPLGWYFLPLMQNAGSFDRDHFAGVVEEVRKMAIPAEKVARFKLKDTSDPSSLTRIPPDKYIPRGEWGGVVWATRDEAGNLTVAIETRDLGHAGEYGFAYSDVPLTLHDFGGGWKRVDVPGHLYITLPEMQIDANWWEVLNNLN